MRGPRRGLLEWFDLPERRFAFSSRLRVPWRRLRFGGFGRGVTFVRPRVIKGGHKIAIGDRCIIYPDASMSVEKRAWGMPGARLTLGNDVVLQSNVTITCAERIAIGDGTSIGGNVLISDNDHTVDGNASTVLEMPIVAAPVIIGRCVWIAANCAVVRGATIGDHCIIGANSVVRTEIPPYSIAVGAPARVVGQVERGA